MRKILKITLVSIIVLVLILIISIFIFGTSDIPRDELEAKYTDEHSKFIEIRGTRVHYKIEGTGAPLLLIHGTGASLHTWDDWTSELKDSMQVIRFDLPAYGLTGPREDRKYDISDYVSFVDDFATKIGLDAFSIAGNSLGGNIAWSYACAHPDKVTKLILIDAAGFPQDDSPLVITIGKTPILNAILKRLTPRSFIKQNINQVYHNDALIKEHVVERYYQLTIREGNRQAFIDRCNLTYVNNTACLASINIPTLIQWGKYDEWIPVGDAHKFADLLRQDTTILYEAGHVPMEELPTETAKDALGFLMYK